MASPNVSIDDCCPDVVLSAPVFLQEDVHRDPLSTHGSDAVLAAPYQLTHSTRSAPASLSAVHERALEKRPLATALRI